MVSFKLFFKYGFGLVVRLFFAQVLIWAQLARTHATIPCRPAIRFTHLVRLLLPQCNPVYSRSRVLQTVGRFQRLVNSSISCDESDFPTGLFELFYCFYANFLCKYQYQDLIRLSLS